MPVGLSAVGCRFEETENPTVGAAESQRVEFAPVFPLSGPAADPRTCRQRDEEYFKRQSKTRHGAFDDAQSAARVRAGVQECAGRSFGPERGRAIHFAVGEFPQVGVEHVTRPSADEQGVGPLDDQDVKVSRRRDWTRSEVGQLVGETFPPGNATPLPRAGRAIGRMGCADQGAQFHEPLVEG